MVRKRDRIIALVIAVTFFLTSFTVSFLVIWDLVKNDKEKTVDTSQINQQRQGKPLEGFTPISKVTALKKEDVKVGTGKTAKVGDSVIVDYTGAVASTGIVFQSSLDMGQPIPLEIKDGSVIDGWVQGIPGMKEGGQRRLIIPAKLAYGEQAQSGIPPNSDLVFDVTLISVGTE